MRLFLEDEGALDLKLPYEELATKVADAVLDYEKCPYEAQVELLLTMNEEIRQMNLEFRGIDRATDVLSFPMTEFPSPADYAYLDTDDSSFDPETGELMLGNIVISKERAKEQAGFCALFFGEEDHDEQHNQAAFWLFAGWPQGTSVYHHPQERS